MKRYLIYYLLFFTLTSAAQEIRFARQSNGGEDATIHSMATDADGNIYYAGLFYLSMDLDSSVAGYMSSYNGSKDGFLAKFDSSGNLIWNFKIGAAYMDFISDVAVDDSGNVAITGHFIDYVNFNPRGATYQIYGGTGNTFIAKYDSSGYLLWVNSSPTGALIKAYGESLSFDDAGNLMCTGRFHGGIDLDPASGSAGVHTSIGDFDIYVVKYTSSGQYVWSFDIGVDYFTEISKDLMLDADANIYIGGYTNSNLSDFDPGPGVAQAQQTTGRSYFLAKYDSSGNFLWLASQGNAGTNTEAYAINLDNYGHVYAAISVMYGSPADVDNGPDSMMFVAKNYVDPVILQFDTNGHLTRGFQMRDTTSSQALSLARSIVSDSNGDVYISGGFSSNGIDFDGGPGLAVRNAVSGTDVFLAKYDSTLSFQWVIQLGGHNGDAGFGYSLLIDPMDDLYMTGVFCGITDFNPGPDSLYLGSTYWSAFTRFYSKWGTQNMPVNINEQLFLPAVNVYPNPSNDFIYLKNVDNTPCEFSLYNVNGKLVKKIKAPLNSCLSVKDLKEGIYLLHVRNLSDNSDFNSRFIKSR